MHTMKHAHGKCHQSATKIGEGWWRTRSDLIVISGFISENLCVDGKIRMQCQVLRVSKNWNKTKGTYREKKQGLIGGNKRHRMVVGAWGLECYRCRNGGLPAWGTNKSNWFNWTDKISTINLKTRTHKIKCCRRSAATTGAGWSWARDNWTCIDGEMGDSRRVRSHGDSL